MTNLTATPSWDDVPQIETTTPLLGGPGGGLNAPAQALLNRSEQAKNDLDALQLADYAALRAYAGPRKSVYVTGSGIAGPFNLRADLDPATTTENGGTRIVGAHVWDRDYDGVALPEWFGAVGDNTADDTVPVKATFAASVRVLLRKIYKVTDDITATLDHQVTGTGFTTSGLSFTGDHRLLVPAPATDKQVSLRLSQFATYGKNGPKIGGTRVTHSGNGTTIPADGAIIGAYINIRHVGTYGASSGDTAYNTDKVRDSSNALVSCASVTTPDLTKTNDDVAAYGVGIQLCKCIDTVIDRPQLYGVGIGVYLIGCDLTRWRGGRAHEVGLFHSEEQVGTWGSQTSIEGADLLHNRRAGGILANNTKFLTVTPDTYYESYTSSALFLLAAGTEGARIEWRIDDPYYTGSGGTASGTTPLALFYQPRWNNVLRPRLQKFTSFDAANPPVAVLGASVNCDSNHPELVALENPNGYSPIRFKDVQIGCRTGTLRQNCYTPANVPERFGGNLSPLAVLDGSKYVFYNASSSKYPTPRFMLRQSQAAYTLKINARAPSGTTIYFRIDHKGADGTTKATVFDSAMGGFNTSTYSIQSQALTLTDPADGDYLLVTWQANTGYIAGMELV